MEPQPETSLQSMRGSSSDGPDLEQEPKPVPPPPPPPALKFDRGAKAWSTMVGAWLTLIATFGYINAFGVYQDRFTRDHAASTENVSWIGATQLFLLIAVGFPAGKLLDMGYFRQTILAGSIIYTFSLFMLSLAHTDKYYQLFLSEGIGMGIGAGLLYVPAMAVQAHHWRQRRILAMGIVITGSSVGGIIFPIMLNQLFLGSAGFAWGVRASGFVVLALLTLANLMMSTQLPRPSGPRPSFLSMVRDLTTDIPYMLTTFGYLAINLGLFLPYFYLQLYSVLHGVDANVAFYSLAVMNAASIPGRVLLNFYAPKLGAFNCLIASCFACVVMLLALFGIHNAAGVIIYAIVYGFVSGAYLALLSPVIASLARNPGEIGTRIGYCFFLAAFGALFGTPIDGALLGSTFPWWRAIIFSAMTALLGTFSIVLARSMVAKKKGTPFV